MDKKGYCFSCDAFVSYSVEEDRGKLTTIDGVTIDYLRHLCRCKKCGELVSVRSWDVEDDIYFSDAYKRKVGMLTSGDIRTYRKKLGLTAESLEKKLNLGKKTITRYERGGYQTPQIDKAMREYFAKHLKTTSSETSWANVGRVKDALDNVQKVYGLSKNLKSDIDEEGRGNHEKILAVCA